MCYFCHVLAHDKRNIVLIRAHACGVFMYYYAKFSVITDELCYDDGCHLRKQARNLFRANRSTTATKLAGLNIVIDKMHFAGHIDEWCKANCNPYSIEQLDKVCMIILQLYYSKTWLTYTVEVHAWWLWTVANHVDIPVPNPSPLHNITFNTFNKAWKLFHSHIPRLHNEICLEPVIKKLHG